MPSFSGADLHCHSTRSDGLDTPSALVRRAVDARLAVLALTDHDSLQGVAELEEAARGTGLVTVAGSELSARDDGEDVHVLGLFVDPEEPSFQGTLAEMRTARETRGEAMVEKLAAIGLPLDLVAIRGAVAGGAFGRPHVARAMVEAGYVSSLDEAFDRYLTKGKPGYAPKPKWTFAEAIAAIHRAGGLAVLAHPIWYRDPERLVSQGAAAGLDGVEVFHSDQDGTKENEFGRLAEREGLLKSAGSDYHGPADGRKRVGGCRLEQELWEALVAAAERRRSASGRPPLDLRPR